MGAMTEHVQRLRESLPLIEDATPAIEEWGGELARRLCAGSRLITAGNGGSAAEAQHLAAELVGRFETERAPLSALCLHAETSSLTAICNDYGPEEAFARQVRAHARAGDVLLLLTTSGRSPNLLAAARAARALDVTTWALTGAAPNPLAELCDEAICLTAPAAATVQELHLVAIHLLCRSVDREISEASAVGAKHVTLGAAEPQISEASATPAAALASDPA
jgi:phosphoheptose isomerase